ncbi:MAG: S-layer homology domain-containing protein [Bacillota bacterium]
MTQGGKFVAIEFDKTFSDVTDHWAKGDIELMASKYVVKGMTDTDYWPNSPVTRAQFVTLLVRSLGLSEVAPATPTFQDVAKDTWYYGFVEAAFKAGLAGGDRPRASTS